MRPTADQLECAAAESVVVLRALMRDCRAPAGSRVQAARTILETKLRLLEMQQTAVREAELERLDPEQAALECLTPEELMILRDSTVAQGHGEDLTPDQSAVAMKYAALAQEWLVRKQRMRGTRRFGPGKRPFGREPRGDK